MLRINEAAQRLGVTPTTLRRWEAQGRIRAVRTPGGERRYDEREIERVRGQQPKRSSAKVVRESPRDHEPMLFDEPEYRTDEEPLPSAPMQSKPWDDTVHEARAGLHVRRIELERSELDRVAMEATARREKKARSDARALQEQQARAQAAESDAQRLVSLRQYGDMLAAIARAPAEVRAAVTRDLVCYVTPLQFPASAWAQSFEYVKARVDRTLLPWREEQAREAEDAAAERENARQRQQQKELIQWGLSYGDRETQFWDERDRSEFAGELKAALRDEIGLDSTRVDVITVVDDILREWDE